MIRRFALRHLAIVLSMTLLVVIAGQPALAHGATSSSAATLSPDARPRIAAWLSGYYAAHHSWAGVDAPLQLAGALLETPLVLVDDDGRLLAGTTQQIPSGEAGAHQALPIYAPDGRMLATLSILGAPAIDGATAGSQPWRAALPTLLAALLMGAATLGLGVGVLRSLRRPLLAVRTTALRLGQGDLGARVEHVGRDEVAALVQAFNTMADGLAVLERRRQALVADVSHDLRTPLTVLGGYLEGLQNGRIADRRSAERAFTAMEDEVSYLAALVGGLNLTSAGLAVAFINPAALIDGAVRRLRVRATACGVTLATALPLSLPAVPADGQGVRRLLANLLENSLRHTPAGGSITVRAAIENPRTGSPQLAIQVCDSGSGIAPEHLPHIFERFYRAAPSEGGHLGVGLTITRAIVADHGGTIAVASQVGVGTVITVCLPLGTR
jgi:two-component system, OmpR family, sensor histidine kinase BaeS